LPVEAPYRLARAPISGKPRWTGKNYMLITAKKLISSPGWDDSYGSTNIIYLPCEGKNFRQNRWTPKESINRPRAGKLRPGVRVEPFEFTSNGGRGSALSRRAKSPKWTFYEVIKIEEKK
jgi:hypothetical protein